MKLNNQQEKFLKEVVNHYDFSGVRIRYVEFVSYIDPDPPMYLLLYTADLRYRAQFCSDLFRDVKLEKNRKYTLKELGL